MDWLSRLDPNVIVPVLVAIGGWLWRKASGEKKADSKGVIGSVIENFAQEVLDRYSVNAGDTTEYLKRVRKYIDERAWPVLSKRGIPKNRVTQSLLNAAIEEWTAWVGSNVRQIRRDKGVSE